MRLAGRRHGRARGKCLPACAAMKAASCRIAAKIKVVPRLRQARLRKERLKSIFRAKQRPGGPSHRSPSSASSRWKCRLRCRRAELRRNSGFSSPTKWCKQQLAATCRWPSGARQGWRAAKRAEPHSRQQGSTAARRPQAGLEQGKGPRCRSLSTRRGSGLHCLCLPHLCRKAEMKKPRCAFAQSPCS